MKIEKVEYLCNFCGKKFKIKYTGWYPTITCIKCGKTAHYTSLGEDSSVSVRKFKDVTAMVVDKKTGQPFWLDTKGRKIRHDSSDVRYDLRNDRFGWKATGKKVTDPNYGKLGGLDGR